MTATTELSIARLERAQRKIANLNDWCHGSAAQDATDQRVHFLSQAAVKHCAVGALAFICAGNFDQAHWTALDALDKAAASILEQSGASCQCDSCALQQGYPIAHLNDCPQLGHNFVMQAFDQAKAELRQRGAAFAVVAAAERNFASDQ